MRRSQQVTALILLTHWVPKYRVIFKMSGGFSQALFSWLLVVFSATTRRSHLELIPFDVPYLSQEGEHRRCSIKLWIQIGIVV
ncbi:hypothetical protein P171DRAFT_10958 [Karstenula rhodostoma CBS 690.94]|uniref:Uncharacterized protein n=1 Tax=Karstenula rhodostoma CBS 690.94 TaxID=1392251 RepID=A0A9P4PWU5_9PLEO|nr:hypothetical protein P171DRAFT_10958 [Karstenula rhodostoma CBS 690.94]